VKLWLDAQISPAMAPWIAVTLGLECAAVRDLGLRDATDAAIFRAAREALAVVVTKDTDFVRLLEQHGPPPQVVWLTCGNTSNQRLREILMATWPAVLALLSFGEPLVEVGDKPQP